MLDSITKKRIDDLRNILVGKIPSPQSQVEQITTGLIYKFMYDMDNEAIEMGGVPSFFVDEFEKYSWKNLFNTKLLGVEKVKLYSDAIENLYNNPNAPLIFREIFKNSFLPFKDPSTLNMFLKEINEFHYSNSEKLGDAYEYLLSFMGSQGDAGQFRTPRHIIDFIVEIINPQKYESILDPACGTAGFLISSFKHILTQNSDKRLGDKLNAADRKMIGKNLVGYDISPDMTRISLVNMYLHQFANPEIHEYDTLSSEDRWNEYSDIILANPPFFSPTGGIKPHSRFGVNSKKAEVLFTNYIVEHLKPNGRAGIIIPEGILFTEDKAYQSLRKQLIDLALVGVISLPAGIFQPYSGVKTSILILDKKLSKINDSIFFVEINNDGFSLGTQRKPIDENDIPNTIDKIKDYLEKGKTEGIEIFKKTLISSKNKYSLNLKKFRPDKNVSNFELRSLAEITNIITCGVAKTPKYEDSGIPFLSAQNVKNGNIIWNKFKYISIKTHQELTKNNKPQIGDILYTRVGSFGEAAVIEENKEFSIFVSLTLIKPKKDIVNPYFLKYILNSEKIKKKAKESTSGIGVQNLNVGAVRNFSIPVPHIDLQEEIVNELNSFQKIIDGSRQVVENYKPKIDIDPSWEMIELSNLISENLDSKRVPISKDKRKTGIIPYYGASGIVDYVEGYLFNENLLLISEDGANLRDRTYPIAFSITGKTWVNNHAHVLKFDDNDIQKFVELYFNQISLEPYLTGSAQPKLNQASLNLIKVPIPPKKEIKVILEKIKEETVIITGNIKLSEKYKRKIQDKVDEVWGGNS